jgi:two-component system phosphate regulon sensor histidine kinase PhoR
MASLFSDIRFYIYFIYGISFLSMAALVITGITRATSYTLVASFWLLAAFGLTHGITEIVDWLRFIEQTSSSTSSVGLLYVSKIFLIFSYILLLQFGINVLTYKKTQSKSPRVIPTILVVVYLAALYVFHITDIRQAGLIARFSFGFVGSVLSAISLIPLINTMKPLGNKKLNRGLIVLAVGLAAYAICGGLIVTPVFGVPIQLFRAICAFSIAIASASILEIFRIKQ